MKPAFYVVSERKLTWLFCLTLGMYTFYWHYKNWKNYTQAGPDGPPPGDAMLPVGRAIFPVFFTHALFRIVKAHAAEHLRPLVWRNDRHATLLVFLTVLTGVLARQQDRGVDVWILASLWIVSLLPLLLCHRTAQSFINASCGDAGGSGNDRFTWANYLWMAAGIALWGYVVRSLLN
ncbi:MAG: hypothetical protein V4631_18800 [Pseudomonadota bacterium]